MISTEFNIEDVRKLDLPSKSFVDYDDDSEVLGAPEPRSSTGTGVNEPRSPNEFVAAGEKKIGLYVVAYSPFGRGGMKLKDLEMGKNLRVEKPKKEKI